MQARAAAPPPTTRRTGRAPGRRPGTRHPWPRSRACRPAAAAAALLLASCVSHYRIHARQTPASVRERSEEIARGSLRVRLEWARPEGTGPFPAVMVHPEGGRTARKMRGVLRSLALHGYLAVAADYRRLADGRSPATSLFAWRDPSDAEIVFDLLRDRAEVDPQRIGAIGFSQGGVYSLIIAARNQGVEAVVAYYPVTDFETWLSNPDRSWPRRQAFRLIRRHFRRKSGARSDAELSEILARASPFRQAESITAPVLLLHGDRDSTAEIGESRRLERRLRELGREVELVEIEGGGHIFNFRDSRLAQEAWERTLAWLDENLDHDRSPP